MNLANASVCQSNIVNLSACTFDSTNLAAVNFGVSKIVHPLTPLNLLVTSNSTIGGISDTTISVQLNNFRFISAGKYTAKAKTNRQMILTLRILYHP